MQHQDFLLLLDPSTSEYFPRMDTSQCMVKVVPDVPVFSCATYPWASEAYRSPKSISPENFSVFSHPFSLERTHKIVPETGRTFVCIGFFRNTLLDVLEKRIESSEFASTHKSTQKS